MMRSIGLVENFASAFCAVQQKRGANVKKLTFGRVRHLSALVGPASPTLAGAHITNLVINPS
jgi:hypothetical protein